MKKRIELSWEDDDLTMLEAVGVWTQEKYRLLYDTLEILSTGMKDLWNQRVYLDLFSGPGCAPLKGTDRVLKGSPLLALSGPHQFDKYIFCDENEEYIDVLRHRIDAHFSSSKVAYVIGDANEKVDEILGHVPRYCCPLDTSTTPA